MGEPKVILTYSSPKECPFYKGNGCHRSCKWLEYCNEKLSSYTDKYIIVNFVIKDTDIVNIYVIRDIFCYHLPLCVYVFHKLEGYFELPFTGCDVYYRWTGCSSCGSRYVEWWDVEVIVWDTEKWRCFGEVEYVGEVVEK